MNESTKLVKTIWHLKNIRSIYQIRKIEILSIVASYNIRINISNKFAPTLEKFSLRLEALNLCANNLSARIKSINIPSNRLFFSMNFYYIGNLYDRILIRGWKLALCCTTLNIKG